MRRRVISTALAFAFGRRLRTLAGGGYLIKRRAATAPGDEDLDCGGKRAREDDWRTERCALASLLLGPPADNLPCAVLFGDSSAVRDATRSTAAADVSGNVGGQRGWPRGLDGILGLLCRAMSLPHYGVLTSRNKSDRRRSRTTFDDARTDFVIRRAAADACGTMPVDVALVDAKKGLRRERQQQH